MEYDLPVRVASEFIGTAILIIIGNGTVANVHLKGSKGYAGGWSLIARSLRKGAASRHAGLPGRGSSAMAALRG